MLESVLENTELLSKRVILSACEQYRYWLSRELHQGEIKPIVFVMLNPSTADGEQDDNTIRRCIDYATKWGGSHLVVVNLFAFRSPKPKVLKASDSPVGDLCDTYIRHALELSSRHNGIVVCAWGEDGKFIGRDRAVFEILKPHNPMAIKINQSGAPAHPLYLKKDAVLSRMLLSIK